MPVVKKLNALTSLRFFAATMVVLIHAAPNFRVPVDPWEPLALNNGVSFFFVLSGFSLTYVYHSGTDLSRGRFLLARVARLWPAHVGALLLFLILVPASKWQSTAPIVWLANLTMVHAWFMTPDFYLSLVGPSWSISVEFAFYLCFMFLVRDLSRTWAPKLAGAFILLLITGRVANWLDQHSPVPDHAWISGLMYYGPCGRLFEFVLGMSTAVLWRRFSPRLQLGLVAGTALEIVSLLLVLFMMSHAQSWSHAASRNSLIGYAGDRWLAAAGFSCWTFAILIFVMALGRGLLSRLLSRPLPVLLGEISYSIYLLHFPILVYFTARPRKLMAAAGGWGFTLYCLITLASAYLVWCLIERPCRHALVKLWPTRTNLIAVELPASMITPEGAPAEPPHRWTVLPSWRGVAVSAAILMLSLVAMSRLPDRCEGRITMVPAPGFPYAGAVYGVDDKSIAGWAWDSREPRKTVMVEVHDGENLLFTLPASEPSEDLAPYLGDCAHAFTHPTPPSLKDGRPHELHFRVANSRFELSGSPRHVEWPAPER